MKMHIRQTDRQKKVTIIKLSVCLSCIDFRVWDFENVAYCLPPITSTHAKWVECLYFLVDWNKFRLSDCYAQKFFMAERLWKSCLLLIAYHLNVYPVRGMSSFSCLTIIRFCLSAMNFCLWETVKKLPIAYRLSPITSTYTKWEECLHFLVWL